MRALPASLAADFIVLLHFAFILFVVLGGLVTVRWPKVAWLHIPAALWGALLEFNGWLCPLTPLENSLRLAAGGRTYSGGFIENYITPVIYPPGLTREMQWLLGGALLLVNAVIYGIWAIRVVRHRQRRAARQDDAKQPS